MLLSEAGLSSLYAKTYFLSFICSCTPIRVPFTNQCWVINMIQSQPADSIQAEISPLGKHQPLESGELDCAQSFLNAIFELDCRSPVLWLTWTSVFLLPVDERYVWNLFVQKRHPCSFSLVPHVAKVVFSWDSFLTPSPAQWCHCTSYRFEADKHPIKKFLRS